MSCAPQFLTEYDILLKGSLPRQVCNYCSTHDRNVFWTQVNLRTGTKPAGLKASYLIGSQFFDGFATGILYAETIQMWLLIAQLTGREIKDYMEPMHNGATACA